MVAKHSWNPTAIRQLLDRVRRMDNAQEQLNAAQFQLIGMERVREAYGDRWEVREERIKQVARHFIKMRLGDDDVLLEGVDGFMIVFGNLEGEIASRTADEIGKRLNEHFTGKCEQPSPSVEVQNRVIATADLLTSLQSSGERDAPASIAAQTELNPEKDIVWRYLPVWNVRLGAPSQYCLTPMGADDLEPIAGYNFETGDPPKQKMAMIDELSMKISNDAVRTIVGAGRRVIVGMSVHVSTLLNLDARAGLMRRAKELDPEFQRYRAVRIAGMAPGFPRLYLDDIMGVLPQLPNVILGAMWNEPDLKPLVDASTAGVSLSLPPIGTDQDALSLRSELLAAVKRAADISHPAHKPLSVSGSFDEEFARQLVDQGADFLTSGKTWPAVPEPADMHVLA